MTTTEIATVDAEVLPQPLSKRDAKALDKKVRAASDRVSKGFATLDDTIAGLGQLIQEAIDGEIHKGLGVKSWTVWVKDAVRVQVPDRFRRKELVRELSKDAGLSQRALAAVFNVSQMTISRDQDGEGPDKVTSLDGAQRPGKTKDVEPEEDEEEGPLDVESEELEEAVPEPMKAVDIVSAFDEETANLWAAYSELHDLAAESKWDGARKRVVKANLNTLGEISQGLQAIIDDLMEN
jgi:transcriptional regulator with XRE-family HTH domain